MEKLIELLNEYSELKEERLTGEEGQPIRKRHDYELEYPIEKIRVISKQYGFIKWLVENDKIDREERMYLMYSDGSVVEGEDRILMILSISNSPIEDLISYLK